MSNQDNGNSIQFIDFFSSDNMASVVAGSRAEVASSHNRTLGEQLSARAIATLCFCPPLSCEGKHLSYLLTRQQEAALQFSV